MVVNNPVISLPHLTNEIVRGARKTKLCAYAVAVEGWRRGLTLKWYTIDSGKYDNMITFGVNPPGRLFSLSSETKTHYFFRTRGDKVANDAVEIGSDKSLTKTILKEKGVPVPEGRKFTKEDSDEAILEYAETIKFPLVFKPTDASLGNGVVTNIKSISELKKAIDFVRHKSQYENVILERYVPGEEYRVYVIEDKVIAAYNRLPANVIADGKHTIKELIDLKNGARMKNARLYSCLIDLDDETMEYIQTAGYTLDSVPKKGEKILLKEKSNVSAGGDPIDVTDEIPQEMKQIAINAVKAVPGLYHAGVDIIVDINSPIEKGAVVIELNPTAQIGGILFPMEGQARDIPSGIVDYYFPDTIGTETEREKIYFDLNAVLEPLQNRSAQEVTVLPALVGKIYTRRMIVKTNRKGARFQRYIKESALDLDISGQITILDSNQIEVIVASSSMAKIEELKSLIKANNGIAKVKRVVIENWNSPVKSGFSMDESIDVDRLKNIGSLLKRAEKDKARLTKQKQQLQKRDRYIKESTSWRLTESFRTVRSKRN
ncbi:ATP-grasp domain-containing protein [Amphibacillus indicireducens]|uniref:Acylphosphatase n=1 Tax=Amphibacillus indicireducens TaxID=1076330 RepID=A0ABP7VKE9_9BACI